MEVKGKELVRVLLAFLDEGEAEAITLAKERNLPILLDERKGRRIAKSLGVRVEGSLGLLVRAKRRGLVSSVRELIKRMLLRGYYLSRELIEEVLRMAGEEKNKV